MKLCRDCEYNTAYGLCSAIYDKQCIVTGKTFKTAQNLHTMRESEAYCGAEAKWFKLKQEIK